MNLIERLIDRQGGASDAAFALRLGVSRELWTKTRAGERPIRHAMASAILRAFPELEGDVLFVLRGGTQIPAYGTVTDRFKRTAKMAAGE